MLHRFKRFNVLIFYDGKGSRSWIKTDSFFSAESTNDFVYG
jgi:hypothetical protein